MVQKDKNKANVIHVLQKDDPISPLPLASQSRALRSVQKRLELIAPLDGPVLITGPSGTGKSTIARAIHAMSRRADEALITRSCGEFDLGTLEATLFGHSADAYTSARTRQEGVLHEADKGTLVLDDIDYLPVSVQSRLLRFLDDGTFYRLGEPGRAVKTDVRIIITSNKDLEHMVSHGKFLPDLLFRMKKWKTFLPSLAERRMDVPIFADQFLLQFQTAHYPEQPGWFFDEPARRFLATLHWVGNLRELSEVVENIAAFTTGDRRPITRTEIQRIISDPSYGLESIMANQAPSISEPEKIYRTLLATSWNISLTARLVGCSRNTIYRRIEENGWRRSARRN